MTPVTLVVGGDAAAREASIAHQLARLPQQGLACGVILQGMLPQALPFAPQLKLVRIAPDCPCCTGKLTMQVTLNRMLRQKPAHLFIGIADAAHRDTFRVWLQQAPYDDLIELDDDLLI